MTPGLIERLEAAGGGSRELDSLVLVEAANDPNTYVANSVFSFRDGWYCTGPDIVCLADPVTTSLDAALALAERVLPGWGFYLRRDSDGSGCGLVPPGLTSVTPGHMQAATPALALCAAILRARSEAR